MNTWQNNEQLVVRNKKIPLKFDAWNTFLFKQQRYKNMESHTFYTSPAGALVCEKIIFI